jgi:ribosomal protein S18 acetylase RimI-like enzyme
LPIRRAGLADFEEVCSIVAEATRWLQSRGIRQWDSYLCDEGQEWLRRRIETAETYLVLDLQGKSIATFAMQWEDPRIWGARGTDGLAGYVHGLAVRRSAAGKNLGLDILNLATEMTAAKRRELLRLDCMATNEPLCEYYRRAGFVGVGVNVIIKDVLSVQFFERRV